MIRRIAFAILTITVATFGLAESASAQRAQFFGSLGNLRLSAPVVAFSRTATGHGYWMAAADGGMFTFGDARFFGSAATVPLHAPVVSMSALPDGSGYWLLASDGGVFSFGKARFRGSGANTGRSGFVDIASTRTGKGYFIVTRNGVVQTFGGAPFLGDLRSVHLNAPIVAIARTPSSHGYWLVAS